MQLALSALRKVAEKTQLLDRWQRRNGSMEGQTAWNVLCCVMCLVFQDPESIDKLAERMKNLLKPFVLRRLKTEVASQLAAKQHKLYSLGMTPAQADAYNREVAQLKSDAGVENLSGCYPTPL